MGNIYANPVGVVKKDIYIITNDINSKVYIGQTKDVDDRFRQYCKTSNVNNSLIGKAIQEYGKEHFRIDVLERQVQNYDEREIYWIKQYNSIDPNGYNILSGGSNPPLFYGEDSPQCKLDNAGLENLKRDLRDSKTPLSDLAKKYSISKRQVVRINEGISRASLIEIYPLRKVPNPSGALAEEDVDIIIELLKYTYFFNGEIARRFGVECHTISDINSGSTHRRSNETYPIRTWKSSGIIVFTYEQVTEIIDLLRNTSLSLNKIAKMYNVNVASVQGVNNGSYKKYRRKDVVYPIRKF